MTGMDDGRTSRTLLVAATASHAGKSTVATGLCRLLSDRGVDVVPFKAQNMSNNARVVARPEDDHWGEIGVSQFVQARAARTTPTTDCNPVLLKPRGDGESQLLLCGRAIDHYSAGSYYDDHWDRALAVAKAAYRRLTAEYDVIVAEGAGSIAEINLHDRDLANIETARFADADILLLVDIERGGAFASLYGTIELLPEDIRDRLVGAVITKFRGDASLLEPGIETIESKTGVPILGVIPYADPGLPEEDSVSLPGAETGGVCGHDDGVPDDRRLTIAVPRLPRISNATDLEVLATEPGVTVKYLPVDPARPIDETTLEADAVVIPGTKNTVDDLYTLCEAGFDDALTEFDGPIVGLCGGYQLLGERITNASLEGTGTADVIDGLGLLPVETRFEPEKRLEQATVPIDPDASPLLAGASGTASGYEIHAGKTRPIAGASLERPLGASSGACGIVLGTYLHGLFDNESVREAMLAAIARQAGVDRPTSGVAVSDQSSTLAGVTPADRAATLVREHVDLEALGRPFVDS